MDGFLPHSFAHRGRRLVYSRGILVLAALSAGLLIVFGGITDNLIPLFAVGAFLAFTLSQAGMVVHWRTVGGQRRKSMAVNAAGAVCTACDAGRRAGLQIRRGRLGDDPAHPGAADRSSSPCRATTRRLPVRLRPPQPLDATNLQPPARPAADPGLERAITRKALRFALKISPDVYALHVADDEEAMAELEDTWEQRVQEPAMAAGLPAPKLIVIYSPYRKLFAPLKHVVSDLQRGHPGRDLAVIVPELVTTRWYHYLLHNQTAAVIKAYLLFSGFRRVVVINVPWYLSA